MITLLLAGLFGWIIYSVFSYYRFVRQFPKGPTPLPFIGNIHQFEIKHLYRSLEKFSEEYGKVFTVFLPNPTVVLADYEAVKEAFLTKGDDFVGRPDNAINDMFLYCPNGGVINSNGDEWREQRRNALSILRDFGMGKNVMEQQVKESIGEYLRCLEEIKDKDHVEMRWPIQMMIANVIHQSLFGTRYDYDDCKPLIDYVEQTGKLFEDLTKSKLLFLAMRFEWIRNIPIIGYYAVEKHARNMQKLFDYIRVEVATTLKDFDAENDEPSCFVQAYVQRAKTNSMLTMDQLHATASDFFLAGQETTTTTMRWAVLYLADHPHVQERMREEMLSVVGPGRLPSMADKSRLPYTTAVCHEVQRVANIIAMNVFHRAEVDTEVQGHKIPKGTFINGDIHYILANDPIFKDPQEFRPERYLNADGKTLNKDAVERTIPFSIGKRQCAGESLARMELFLGLASTIQRYHILPPLNGPINYEHQDKQIITPNANFLRLQPFV